MRRTGSVGARRRGARLGAGAAAVALLATTAAVTGAASGTAVAAGSHTVGGRTFTVEQVLSGTGSSIRVAKSASSRVAQTDTSLLGQSSTAPVNLVVKLDLDGTAVYTGGIEGLEATSPSVTGHKLQASSSAVKRYQAYAKGVQTKFIAALKQAVPSARAGRALTTVYGGVAVRMPANEVGKVLALPGVVAVQKDALGTPLTDSSNDFIGSPTIWNQLGGQATAGKGVIYASLDSGVWPEHPSFAGTGTPPTRPDGSTRTCDFGDNPLTPAVDVFQCQGKLIGGAKFLDTYDFLAGLGVVTPEVYSTTRDSNGHGTHTASTSVGNPVDDVKIFGVQRGPISGIAPAAMVSVYKVCGLDGCFGSDTAAAVGQAIEDGADVINFSISGGSSPYTDPTELAFLDAYAAGVFVSASAGNSGPGAATADHAGPWVTTVAASTQARAFESKLTLTSGSDTLELAGAGITGGTAKAFPVVQAKDVAGYGDQFCGKTPAADAFTGKIVVCARGGGIGRVQKGKNVLDGGGEGMILYNPTLQDTETDNHFLPAVHLPVGTELLAFLSAHADVTAEIGPGTKTFGTGDVMAGFSSRGPLGAWIKPDVTAPGVQILAGNTPTPDEVAGGPAGQYFQAIAGTSMSSPHVAGAGTLLKALHPDWTPGQIKSALMTSAERDLVKEDETTPADPYDFGAGRIDLTKAGDPGITISATARDMVRPFVNPLASADLNIPSIQVNPLPGGVITKRTVTNVSGGSISYDVGSTAQAGLTVKVSPSSFTLPAGGTQELTVTLLSTEPAGTLLFGSLELTEQGGSGRDAHLPIAVTTGQGDVSLSTSCTNTTVMVKSPTWCTVTATNLATTPAMVSLTSKLRGTPARVTAATGATVTSPFEVTAPGTELPGKQFGAPKLRALDPSDVWYLPLDLFGVSFSPLSDEQIDNLDVPAFQYAGDSYSSIGVVSNGYAVVGGGTSADVSFEPKPFPTTGRPNNLLAPYWGDLDGGGSRGYAAAVLRDGSQRWLVIEWEVHPYGDEGNDKHFQVWIGLNGTEDIHFGYDPDRLPGLPTVTGSAPILGVGAENLDASAGDGFLDRAPVVSYAVESAPGAPGGSLSYTMRIRGQDRGSVLLRSILRSSSVRGRTFDDLALNVVNGG